MSGPYHFVADAKTDDGKEVERFLIDNGHLGTLPSGNYRVASGTRVGPGTLGVLPAGVTYILDPVVGYILKR